MKKSEHPLFNDRNEQIVKKILEFDKNLSLRGTNRSTKQTFDSLFNGETLPKTMALFFYCHRELIEIGEPDIVKFVGQEVDHIDLTSEESSRREKATQILLLNILKCDMTSQSASIYKEERNIEQQLDILTGLINDKLPDLKKLDIFLAHGMRIATLRTKDAIKICEKVLLLTRGENLFAKSFITRAKGTDYLKERLGSILAKVKQREEETEKAIREIREERKRKELIEYIKNVDLENEEPESLMEKFKGLLQN